MRISVKYSTIIVEDMDKSVAFYRDEMGFKTGYHVEFPELNQQITLMESPDGATVELIENHNLPVGFWSVGTDVDNLEEILKSFEQKGIKHTPVVPTTVGKMCFITDPNGVRICLIEHLKK